MVVRYALEPTCFSISSQVVHKKDAPRRPQDGPRWPQDGPKMAPRWPQDGPKMALLDRFGFSFLLACCIYVVVRKSHYNKFPLLRNTFGATWLKMAFLGCLELPWLVFFSASCCIYVVVRKSHYNKFTLLRNTFGAFKSPSARTGSKQIWGAAACPPQEFSII